MKNNRVKLLFSDLFLLSLFGLNSLFVHVILIQKKNFLRGDYI